MKLTAGSFSYIRALGGRVVADTGSAIPVEEIPFAKGYTPPYVGLRIVASNPLPECVQEGASAGSAAKKT